MQRAVERLAEIGLVGVRADGRLLAGGGDALVVVIGRQVEGERTEVYPVVAVRADGHVGRAEVERAGGVSVLPVGGARVGEVDAGVNAELPAGSDRYRVRQF